MMNLARSGIDDLGERIFRWRDEKGWTQSELARRARISRTTLSNLESGSTRSPSSATIYRIAGAFEVKAYELLTGEPAETKK